MRVVWKFAVPPAYGSADNPVPMPADAVIVHAGADPNGVVSVWAIVDPSAPTEPRYVHFVGTGHDLGEEDGVEIVYLGAARSGPFVWHVIETRRRPTS